MKLLVTGRAGQLARSLAERANAAANIEITRLGRPELDLEQPGSAAEAITRIRPDVVINAAAYTDVDKAEDEPQRAFRVNGEAVGELANACRSAGARLIQISTDYVFDGEGAGAYTEADPTRPLGVYGRSKLLGEEQARAGNAEHLIIRTAWVYSPFGRNFVRSMMDAARQREVLTVVADQYGNPTSALDLADALFSIARDWSNGSSTGVGATYHVAGSGETNWCGFAQAIMDECSRNGVRTAEVQSIATEDWPTRARRPANTTLDCSRFKRDFGLVMPEWRRSLGSVVRRLAGAAQ